MIIIVSFDISKFANILHLFAGDHYFFAVIYIINYINNAIFNA